MSKHNLFKGKARGSIGDVTFTVLNDTQVAKVRNRHPRNPHTDAQMFQRAVWATIMRIYSAGKSFFSQSFEEATTPQQNMNAFTSLNMQYLRELLTQEIEQQTPINEQLGRVVHPKTGTPIPLPGLIISQGTLQADFFTIRPATETDYITISIPAPINATETIQQYATRVGLSPEIVYTFVIFLNDLTTIVAKVDGIYNDYTTQYAAYFDTLQLTCRQDLPDKPMSTATIGDIFDMSSPYNIFTPSITDITIGNATLPITTILRRNNPRGTFGVSAYHNTTLQTDNATMQPISIINNYGIATQYIENAWFTEKKQPTNINVEIPDIRPYNHELEYIEMYNTNDAPYIDTGIKSNNPNLNIIARIMPLGFPTGSSQRTIFGNIDYRGIRDEVNYIIYYRYGENASIYGSANFTNFTQLNIENYNNQIVEVQTNGLELYYKMGIYSAKGYRKTSYTNDNNIHIFSITTNNREYFRLYDFKIYENDTLIQHLIPVEKNGVAMMYDKISKKLFENKGTGSFNAGPKLK